MENIIYKKSIGPNGYEIVVYRAGNRHFSPHCVILEHAEDGQIPRYTTLAVYPVKSDAVTFAAVLSQCFTEMEIRDYANALRNAHNDAVERLERRVHRARYGFDSADGLKGESPEVEVR